MNEDVEQRPVLPEIHFKVITVSIVLTAVITGILVPNGEIIFFIYIYCLIIQDMYLLSNCKPH